MLNFNIINHNKPGGYVSESVYCFTFAVPDGTLNEAPLVTDSFPPNNKSNFNCLSINNSVGSKLASEALSETLRYFVIAFCRPLVLIVCFVVVCVRINRYKGYRYALNMQSTARA